MTEPTIGDYMDVVYGAQDVLYSEENSEKQYQQTLVQVRDIFDKGDATRVVEALAPFLNIGNELATCNAIQAQLLYPQLSKGLEVASTLYGKAIADRNNAISYWKSLRGKYYLEMFAFYQQQMKEKNVTIKDTDASREHFLNTQPEIIEAKKSVDFYEALVTTIDGWKSKLFSDMTNARNLIYSKRYSDQLSSTAN